MACTDIVEIAKVLEVAVCEVVEAVGDVSVKLVKVFVAFVLNVFVAVEVVMLVMLMVWGIGRCCRGFLTTSYEERFCFAWKYATYIAFIASTTCGYMPAK